jgi:hypothetical protein
MLAVTIGSAKRVRDLLQVDLLRPNEGEPVLVGRLNTDVAALIDVIFALVKPQADERGVTDVDFAEALDGQAAYDAWLGFMEDWRGFFQKLRRDDLATMIDRTIALVRKAVEFQDNLVDREAEKMERTLGAMGGPGQTSGSTPAERESTPTG